MTMLDRFNKAVSSAFSIAGLDVSKCHEVDYLVHMNENDARDLHRELSARNASFGVSFDEFLSTTSVRVDPALPRGKIEVEFSQKTEDFVYS